MAVGRLIQSFTIGLVSAATLLAIAVAYTSNWRVHIEFEYRTPWIEGLMADSASDFQPIAFSDIPAWEDDDHAAAFHAFVVSCGPVVQAARSGRRSGVKKPTSGLLKVCDLAVEKQQGSGSVSQKDARAFFEAHFVPHRFDQVEKPGLLTGYYEPLIEGSRTRTSDFQTPVYRRPPDLENVVAESERGAKAQAFTHMRRTADGLEPYMTREEIDKGGLKGQGLELMYFRDPIDVFFMQVQGSARIRLTNGETVRITYDGKNGHPYSSIGMHLAESGQLSGSQLSLQGVADWLKADLDRAFPVMWVNKSYVFFRELDGQEAEAAMGVLNIPLQEGRSLAVDTTFHAIGTPIFVSAPTIKHAEPKSGFARLMVAHDVGSAIVGPERGDIYFGSGDAAGELAGITKHVGEFTVLLPRMETTRTVAGVEK